MAHTATLPAPKAIGDYMTYTFFQWKGKVAQKDTRRLFLYLWLWDGDADENTHYVMVMEFVNGTRVSRGRKWPTVDFNNQLRMGTLKHVGINSAE